MKVVILDTNVIVRFLLNDHPVLSNKAKEIIGEAVAGKICLYLDEIVVAELVWLLTSFYGMRKTEVIDKIEEVLRYNFIVNPRKSLITEALVLFRKSNLEYIDCWVKVLAERKGIDLVTFDKKLGKVG